MRERGRPGGFAERAQDVRPEELRGRAMTPMTAGMMTVQGVGMALAGLAAEFFPVHRVVAGSGVLGTVCLPALLLEVRRTETRDRGATEEPDRGARQG